MALVEIHNADAAEIMVYADVVLQYPLPEYNT
jgi:hypothetical protein